MEHETTTSCVIGAAMRVQTALGPGYLESVYHKALDWELRLCGVAAESERPLQVRYRGALVGAFVADLLVDGIVLVEIKAVRALSPTHEAQVVNYLTATGIDVGLLINFGAPRLEFRRKNRIYRPGGSRQDPREGEEGDGGQDEQDEQDVGTSFGTEGPTATTRKGTR